MSTFLITFPTSDDKIENIILDKQSGSIFVKEMLMILERLDCEVDVVVYIDSANKNKFTEDFIALENLLNQRIGAYDLQTTLLSFISQNGIRILRNSNFVPDVKIVLMEGFNRVDEFFTQKNKDRKLNRNDFRHCESHPNYLRNKSPLIGGINGFDNAEKLLPSAIGDAKTNRSVLLNIDGDSEGHIIRYENESFGNQYHAYHIVKKENGEYVVDIRGLQLLKSSKKNLKRPLRLVQYRNTKAN